MEQIKTKSLRNIEERMSGIEEGSLRYRVLEDAKNFKTSWVNLGRALYSVWRDKLYREWGYNSFDAYTAREIGLKKQTAVKLLRSYYFLEKEEPHYLSADYSESQTPANIPGYEAIDVLRLAKNKKDVDEEDYAQIKKDIFEKGKDVSQVKKDLTALIRQRQELEPEEAYQKRRLSTVRRLLGTLRALKQEAELSKLLPAPIIKEAANLIKKLEAEL